MPRLDQGRDVARKNTKARRARNTKRGIANPKPYQPPKAAPRAAAPRRAAAPPIMRKPERRKNVRKALKVANALGANHKAKKALISAMGTESNYENLKGGDRDSQGVLQVRANMHGGKMARSVPHSVWQFLERGFTGKGGAIALSKTGMKSADIAQAVQGSGPNVYSQRSKEAAKILKAYDSPEVRVIRAAYRRAKR